MKNIRVLVSDLAHMSIMVLLLAGPAALSQGTMERVPDGDTNQNPPRLHSFNLPQMVQVGEIEVLNGPVSFHLANYLRSGVLPNIRVNWQRALNNKALIPTSEQKELVVEFTIMKDGGVGDAKMVEGSGNAEVDHAALDGVTKSAPFRPWPDEFSGEYLQLRCHFFLNSGRMVHAVRRVARDSGSTNAADNTPGAGEPTVRSGGSTRPRAIYAPEPEYTEQARKAKVHGTVVLTVSVSTTGDVADVKVVKGLGSGLDEKAIEAVRTWKFKPGMEDGIPVSSEITVEASFHLYNQR